MNYPHSLLVAGYLVIFALAGRSASAQATPEAQAIMLQASQFAKSVKTVYGDITTTSTTDRGTSVLHSQVWAEMPDKILTRDKTPTGGTAIYTVGTQRTAYFHRLNKYTTTSNKPENTTKHIYELLVGGLEGVGPLADRTGNRKITLVGKETIAGIATNHLRITIGEGANGDLWIADGPKPLPVYLRFSMSQPQLAGESYCRWVIDQPLPPGIFQFTPPPGATSMSGAKGGQ